MRTASPLSQERSSSASGRRGSIRNTLTVIGAEDTPPVTRTAR
jgi:hypothetical protein